MSRITKMMTDITPDQIQEFLNGFEAVIAWDSLRDRKMVLNGNGDIVIRIGDEADVTVRNYHMAAKIYNDANGGKQ